MNSSLENLVDILRRDRFGILASVFPKLSSTELKLLEEKREKDITPIHIEGGREKLSEKILTASYWMA